MSYDFKNKVALVTGAASGIGAAVAAELARDGAKVVFADRDAAGAASVVTAIKQVGGRRSSGV